MSDRRAYHFRTRVLGQLHQRSHSVSTRSIHVCSAVYGSENLFITSAPAQRQEILVIHHRLSLWFGLCLLLRLVARQQRNYLRILELLVLECKVNSLAQIVINCLNIRAFGEQHLHDFRAVLGRRENQRGKPHKYRDPALAKLALKPCPELQDKPYQEQRGQDRGKADETPGSMQLGRHDEDCSACSGTYYHRHGKRHYGDVAVVLGPYYLLVHERYCEKQKKYSSAYPERVYCYPEQNQYMLSAEQKRARDGRGRQRHAVRQDAALRRALVLCHRKEHCKGEERSEQEERLQHQRYEEFHDTASGCGCQRSIFADAFSSATNASSARPLA